MSRYAVIHNGDVVKVVMADNAGDVHLESGQITRPANASAAPGWRYENKAFVAPAASPLAGQELFLAIREECRNRIVAVMSPSDQRRAADQITAGQLPSPHREAFPIWTQWNTDMITRSRAMQAAGDQDFRRDDKWPPAPAEVTALSEYLNNREGV